MNLLQDFKNKPFIEAVQSFFKNLNVPINEITTTPATAIDIIGESPVNAFINEVYAYGIVDDAIFEQNETFKNLAEVKSLKADYDGILIFGIILIPRENNSLPTRTQFWYCCSFSDCCANKNGIQPRNKKCFHVCTWSYDYYINASFCHDDLNLYH